MARRCFFITLTGEGCPVTDVCVCECVWGRDRSYVCVCVNMCGEEIDLMCVCVTVCGGEIHLCGVCG